MQGMTVLPFLVEEVKTRDYLKPVKRVCAYAMLALLSGYTVKLMNSARDIGAQEQSLIIFASVLTLLVVIPIIFWNIFFVSRRRASNTTARHPSRCSPSTKKEIAAWAILIIMVAVLTFLGWGITHSLDIYKPIGSKVAPVRMVAAVGT